MSDDATTLPSELSAPLQPLVAFYCLDITGNSVHKAVWDTFSKNRKADRVNYKVLPRNYNFPITKPKRVSYEWYQPKGILKRSWMPKHLCDLPAVVVYFIELEWNDAHWSEKQVQCVAVMQTLKNQLCERFTRICLVLLQETVTVNARSDDAQTAELATILCTACGINSKMLFILPYTEHMSGFAMRLESEFLDMAQSYYTLMSKRIRSHRDQLTAIHLTLKVRHQFKLGFVAEIRQDFNSALKHYTQGYASLDEIKMTEENCFEIKVCAGFFSYKICHLMFQLKVPRDAINQFISHITKYKNRVGYRELVFEHYAWLSTQHRIFAELFCEAVKNGLPALQTQHPGIYYQKSAKYLHKRRESFHQSSAKHTSVPESDLPIDSASVLSHDFFGIYTLRSEKVMSAQQIFSVLLKSERNFNHAIAIIKLLGQAMLQFKTYKCPRFRKKLATKMAEEYFNSGDQANALTLYSLMLTDYREEKWMAIFSDVLLKTLRAATLAGSVSEYVSCSIEALSTQIAYDHKDRVLGLENLWKVLQSVPPVSPSILGPDISRMWQKSLQLVKSPIHIDMSNTFKLFEICVSFEHGGIKQTDILRVQLIMRILTDVPIKLYDMALYITDNINTYKLPARQYSKSVKFGDFRDKPFSSHGHKVDHELKLDYGYFYEYQFTSDAHRFFENTQLHAVRFEAYMGREKLRTRLTENVSYKQKKFRSCYNSFDGIVPTNPTCCIIPTFHIVTQSNIDNGINMLANEYLAVTTNVSNPHKVSLRQVTLNISVCSHLLNKVFLSTDISPSRQKLHSAIQIDLGELDINGTNALHYYVYSMIGTTLNLQQKIVYNLDEMLMQNLSKLSEMQSHIAEWDSTEDFSADQRDTNSKEILSTSNMAPKKPPALLPKNFKPINIEFLDDNLVRKSCDDILLIKCDLEFNVHAKLYSLNKKPLSKLYRGERFLLRIHYSVHAPCPLEILDSFFICECDLLQSPYSCNGRKHNKIYNHRDQLEDVIMLRTFAVSDFPTYSKYTNDQLRMLRLASKQRTSTTKNTKKVMEVEDTAHKQAITNRLVFHKGLDAIQATAHSRGFIKGVYTVDQPQKSVSSLGIFCIKWRRHGHEDENESKFVIAGMDVEDPPLSIHCSIDERIFVKMPMTLRIVLKNPTNRALHLTATLFISLTDNFICSGHKQLDVSLFAYSDKTLVYNLYPLCIGWQNAPELTLEYNSQVDPNIDESQNLILQELVQRAVPKKIFVLPPLKQLAK